MTIENLDAMLQKAFDESTKIYQQRGFQRRIGFGRKPGLVSVDLANAWTLPGNPFTCERIDEEIIPGMQRLLAACRTNDTLLFTSRRPTKSPIETIQSPIWAFGTTRFRSSRSISKTNISGPLILELPRSRAST
jgi:hypothetical protein